jgi:hypothetical protein
MERPWLIRSDCVAPNNTEAEISGRPYFNQNATQLWEQTPQFSVMQYKVAKLDIYDRYCAWFLNLEAHMGGS